MIDRNSKNEFNIDIHDPLNVNIIQLIQLIIKLLNYPINDRKKNQINTISHFLEKTNLSQKFIFEKFPESSFHKLFNFCSQNIHYKYIEKGQILYKEG